MGELGRLRIEDELAWVHQAPIYVVVYDRLLGVPRRELGEVISRRSRVERCAASPAAISDTTARSLARAMADLLAHRGPDAHGAYDFETENVRCTLAHRRLSIIDLSDAGTQPFTKDGLSLVYNGELYNYRELRAELVAAGVRFRTSTDTEVVLEAWRHFGPGALARFRGMFAFARLRRADRTTSFSPATSSGSSRSSTSRSPTDGSVVFASELKAIARHRRTTSSRVDLATLVASILYYWVPDQRCAFENVRKLPPGTWAEFRPDGTERVHQYWSIVDVARGCRGRAARRPRPGDRGRSRRAPGRRRARVDVPLGRTRLEHRQRARAPSQAGRRVHDHVPARGPAARGDARRRDLRPQGRRRATASHCTRSRSHPTSPNLLAAVVDILDEPIGDPAAINTLLICEAARDAGVKVLLSGMGADELFGGYRKHLACVTAARYQRVPRSLRTGVVRPAVDRMPVAVGDARPADRHGGQNGS